MLPYPRVIFKYRLRKLPYLATELPFSLVQSVKVKALIVSVLIFIQFKDYLITYVL